MRPADHHTDGKPGVPRPSGPSGPTSGPEADAPNVPPAAAEALLSALRAAVATGAIDAEPLRSAVRAFTDTLRAIGEPPERALIAVKHLVTDATHRRRDIDPAVSTALLRCVVQWAVQAYYRAD